MICSFRISRRGTSSCNGPAGCTGTAGPARPRPAPTLRAFLKAGRLFSELSGLMPPEAATALAGLPMGAVGTVAHLGTAVVVTGEEIEPIAAELEQFGEGDRKSTRLNLSHKPISYAVFCLKKKNPTHYTDVLWSRNKHRPLTHSCQS